ncbi:MAG: NrfD/PsrC family molybdoenzyme membrane anchor subunit [Symbiobacteriia bacterium]
MKSSRWIFALLWLAGLVVGGIGVVERFLDGHRLAAYTSYVPWGIWVAAYIYFVGLSVGAFLLASVIYAFGLKRFEQVGRVALATAFVTLVMALLSIWFDLGHLERFFYVFTRPNFRSVMAWMIWMYTAYAVFLAFMAYRSLWGGAGMRLLGMIGIPVAVAVPGGGGALFATLIAREYWHSSLYPVLFVIGGVVSGLALVLALVAFFGRPQDAIQSEFVQVAGRVTLGLLLFDAVLEWAEFSVPMWYGTGAEYQLLRTVLFGSHWYVFWVFHLLLGVVAPVLLLALYPRARWAAGAGGALAAAMFFAVRLNLVIPGLITPQLQGLQDAYQSHRLSYAYTPSLFEWQVLLFVVVFGIGLLYLAYRYLPLSAEPQGLNRRPAGRGQSAGAAGQ